MWGEREIEGEGWGVDGGRKEEVGSWSGVEDVEGETSGFG